MVTVVGLLLIFDLCVLPWHHFALTVNLKDVGLQDVGGISIDRTGIRSPGAYLGMGAVMIAALLVVMAVTGMLGRGPSLGVVAGRGGAADQPPSAFGQQLPLIAAPAVFGLLVAKLMVNRDYLGYGAWIGVVLAGVFAYGGVLLSKESAAAVEDPESDAPISP